MSAFLYWLAVLLLSSVIPVGNVFFASAIYSSILIFLLLSLPLTRLLLSVIILEFIVIVISACAADFFLIFGYYAENNVFYSEFSLMIWTINAVELILLLVGIHNGGAVISRPAHRFFGILGTDNNVRRGNL